MQETKYNDQFSRSISGINPCFPKFLQQRMPITEHRVDWILLRLTENTKYKQQSKAEQKNKCKLESWAEKKLIGFNILFFASHYPYLTLLKYFNSDTI